MTKFTLIVLLSFLTSFSWAQTKMGVSISTGSSIVDIYGSNGSFKITEEFGLNLGLGFEVEQSLYNKGLIHLHSGIRTNYTQANFSYPNITEINGGADPLVQQNFRALHNNVQLNIPLKLGVRYSKFAVNAGVNFTYNYYRDAWFGWDEVTQGFKRVIKDYSEESPVEPILWSVEGALSYQLGDHWTAELQYNQGLTQYFILQKPELNPNYNSVLYQGLLRMTYYFHSSK